MQAVGPEHFGIVAVDCAKHRSKWLLCNFYGKVIVEPSTVEHTNGGLRTMTQRVAEVCQTEGLTDTIVAVEIFHAAVKGYGLAAFPVGEVYQSLQTVSRHRHNLVKQRSRLMVQPNPWPSWLARNIAARNTSAS